MHYTETTQHRDVPLQPWREQWEAVEDAGMLRCFTSRLGNRLIAYAVFSVAPDPQCYSVLQAQQCSLFVHPDQRSGLTTLRLIRHCVNELTKEGCGEIVMRSKVHSGLGRLLAAEGFAMTEYTYCKTLPRPSPCLSPSPSPRLP